MANTRLKPVSVYIDPELYPTIARAAANENRSVSNYLATHGLLRAQAQEAEGTAVEGAGE